MVRRQRKTYGYVPLGYGAKITRHNDLALNIDVPHTLLFFSHWGKKQAISKWSRELVRCALYVREGLCILIDPSSLERLPKLAYFSMIRADRLSVEDASKLRCRAGEEDTEVIVTCSTDDSFYNGDTSTYIHWARWFFAGLSDFFVIQWKRMDSLQPTSLVTRHWISLDQHKILKKPENRQVYQNTTTGNLIVKKRMINQQPLYSVETMKMTILDQRGDCILVKSRRFGKIRLSPVDDTWLNCLPDLRHQNIIAHYGLVDGGNGEIYIMTDHTLGGSLRENLETRKDLTEGDLALWILDAARGLRYVIVEEIPYGRISLDSIYASGARAKIEHPLLTKEMPCSPLQAFLDFIEVIITASRLLNVDNSNNLLRLARQIQDIAISQPLDDRFPLLACDVIIRLLEKQIPSENRQNYEQVTLVDPVGKWNQAWEFGDYQTVTSQGYERM